MPCARARARAPGPRSRRRSPPRCAAARRPDQAAVVGLHARLVEARGPPRRDRAPRRCTGSRTRACRRRRSPSPTTSPASAPSTFASVTISMFCFFSSRAACRAISSSSSGRICGSASSRTTSVPIRPNALAISVPDAPAPITASRFGCSPRCQQAAVSRMRSPNSQPEQRLRDGARGEHDLAGLDLVAVEAPADHHVAVVGQRAVALDQVDLVLLEQARDAAGQGLDHLVAVSGGALEVDLDALRLDAELLAVKRLRSRPPPRAASPWPGCTRSSGSGRRPCPSRRRPSSSRAGRRGSRRRSRPAPTR